ncbi:hypothetical protein [Dyella nitratireducens]|nr:hypothetical protein [Dyella nitratireducens]
MMVERIDGHVLHVENGVNSAANEGMPHPFSQAEATQGSIRPSSLASGGSRLWLPQQQGSRSNRALFSQEESQSPWRPTIGPWGGQPGSPPVRQPSPPPVPAGVTDFQRHARLDFESAAVSLQTGLVHGVTAIGDFQNGRYLLGLNYGVSTFGNLLQGTSQVLSGLSNVAKATGQNHVGNQLKDFSNYLRAGGGPLAGFGRSLRDIDTALTTLADRTKSPYEKQRDLAFAIGTILNTAGASGSAVSALTGNPDEFLRRVETRLADSGGILRGLQNLQRNAQGLNNALSPFNLRNVSAYGAGVIYGLSEASAGLGHALAQALKESGYTRASEALTAISERAHNISLLASNTQLLINTLVPATR